MIIGGLSRLLRWDYDGRPRPRVPRTIIRELREYLAGHEDKVEAHVEMTWSFLGALALFGRHESSLRRAGYARRNDLFRVPAGRTLLLEEELISVEMRQELHVMMAAMVVVQRLRADTDIYQLELLCFLLADAWAVQTGFGTAGRVPVELADDIGRLPVDEPMDRRQVTAALVDEIDRLKRGAR